MRQNRSGLQPRFASRLTIFWRFRGKVLDKLLYGNAARQFGLGD